MKMRKPLILGAMVTAAVSLATLTATPASAAAGDVTVKCGSTTRTFDLPYKPDLKVTAKTCLQRTTGYNGAAGFYAYTTVSWNGTYDWIGGTRVNAFNVTTRLERYDSNMDPSGTGTYNIGSSVNRHENGSSSTTASSPYRPGRTVYKDARGGWTADGVIKVDIADDGKGAVTWNLHGSPQLS